MTQAVSFRRASICGKPYRLLFLLAGLWALVVPTVWLLPEELVPERVGWHSRELLFGMGGAAAGGYLLTALPAWTRRGPVPPAVTVIAACLWGAARLTAAFPDHLALEAATVVTSGYFVFLTAILMRGVVSCGAWHRLWAPLGTAALAVNSVLSLHDGPSPANSVPMLYIFLIVVIGGRAVPAFTRSWMDRMGGGRSVCDRPELSLMAILGILAATLAGGSQHNLSGVLLLFSAPLLLLQMKGWQSLKTGRYPALFILHVAFAWTPAALVLGGLASIFPDRIPPAASLHALTMGAMGTMMAALMMRPAMVRDGETLILSRTMAWAFSLVSLSALLRIGASWIEDGYFNLVAAAATCWMAGWGLFLVTFLPSMSGPPPRPAFSAATGNGQRSGKRAQTWTMLHPTHREKRHGTR
ncbi:NnrS family protein [Ensifer sp. BR816]|uniref:NnrS family protein n=1 Tax=Rhizobium sp. (strain BR816) TaxID=1057002 RepID=UPI00037F5F07|nr:NnrS family protein [Ensifer sp. BR816]